MVVHKYVLTLRNAQKDLSLVALVAGITKLDQYQSSVKISVPWTLTCTYGRVMHHRCLSRISI